MAAVLLVSISRGRGDGREHVGILCTHDAEFAAMLKQKLEEFDKYTVAIRRLPGPSESDFLS